MQGVTKEELNTALYEIQRYLLDEIPPITATEAVQILMGYPPDLLMKQMNVFAVEQGRIQGASMADCLFHALKKVHMISTLKLIEQSSLEKYLNTVIPLALSACPPEDRQTLKTNLESLRNELNFSTSVSAVDLGVPSAKKKQPVAALSEMAAKTARRFSLVIDRLMKKGAGALAAMAAPSPAAPGAPAEQPMAQLASMAADSASSEEELNQFLEEIKPLSGGKPVSDIISLLASSVPGWEIVPPTGSKPGKSIQAMHKIMTLTKDPTVAASRYRGLMMCAVEQFNTGSVGAAASMLELADVVVKEKRLDANTVERVRNDAQNALSSEQLKKYTENKAKHPILRKVLGYFPKLRKEQLFADLRGEEKPERRRAVLSLLEAYGQEARDAALGELEKELDRHQGEADTYYLRNLIYLLHRIARENDEKFDREFELLKRSSEIGQNIFVIKEAVIPLGQVKSDAAVKLLTMRLAEFEAMLLRSKDGAALPYPVEEVQKLLDRIVAALARIGTPAALLTAARHGMRANPILGDTRARMAALSQYDLSFDEQTVNIIIKAIREDLPSGNLLGRFIPKKQPPPVKLIEALSGTRSEVVETVFGEIARDFPEEEIGRAAAAALEKLSSAVKPAAAREGATLTGDLQFFGLPALMQSLSDTQATGIVTLIGNQGTAGKLLFLNGQIADAQAGHLRGVDAVYQLLERPIVGSFAFVPAHPENVKTKNEPKGVMSILLEGIRRHDEFKQACLVVPDDMVVRATSTKPTPPPDENDPSIVREVWVKASKGGKVAEWESQIAADAYRIRRLVAHWIDEGALQPATA